VKKFDKNRSIILFFMVVLLAGFLFKIPFAQANNGNWETFYIKDVGWIDFPPTMELQSAEYRTKAGVKTLANKTIFQQKGLNQNIYESHFKYVRLIVELTSGKEGDFLRVTDADDILGTSNEELKELGDYFFDLFKTQQIKIIEWYGAKTVKLNNGYAALMLAFKREGATSSPVQGPVIVRQYLIQNNKQMISITISYRAQEEELWKDDLLKAVNSFKLANIF